MRIEKQNLNDLLLFDTRGVKDDKKQNAQR